MTIIPSLVSNPSQSAWTRLPLYTEPANTASTYASSNPTDSNAGLIRRMGATPVAHWFGDWDTNPTAAIAAYTSAAKQANAMPVAVLYNIPDRDCGNYSAGGVASGATYLEWVKSVTAGIADNPAVVILEPDALAGADCLSASDRQERFNLIGHAVDILKTSPNTVVYIDAGNPAWQTATLMAERLKAANISGADGFSLNVSNYTATSRNQQYGDQISKLVGDKHYVIDTSRNGNSNLSPEEWCNNHAAAFGDSPTTKTGNGRNDALLWVKIPWESDGTCNGGPRAGEAFWTFATQLARNAGW